MSFVILLSCLGTCACKKVTNEFPTIPSAPTSESTDPSESENTTVASAIELTIASPLSYDTCQYLAKLYIAKSQGLLGDGVTGDTVDLSYLDSIDLPFLLKVYGTSETGCNSATLKKWKSNGSMPDIFLTDSFDEVVKDGLAMPVTSQLSSITLLSADRIYPRQVSQFFVNGEQYGIPYQTSCAVLFCDMEVLITAGIPAVSFRQSRNSLLTLLSQIDELNAEEKTVLPFYQAEDMVPYLPCAMYNHTYLSSSSEEDQNEQAYRDSFSYVESLIRSGYSSETLTAEDSELLFAGVSPLLSRKVGIWVGTTDQLPIYDNYMPNTLSLMQFPGMKDDEYTVPLLISYPFCVSSSCEDPQLACELMSFIALDEDALLLSARLQPREGYLPSISSPSVWSGIMSSRKYGNYLAQYYELMGQAIYIPSVSQSSLYQKDVEFLQERIAGLFPIEPDEENE
ncbi:MAG: hypothetical protein J5379_10650 [Clostridiales bacterium]|nr:hypothetical protein [Clostridiales bacterium]